IIIGARSILLKARLYAKNPPAPDVSQYCEPTETKPSKEKKTYVESKEKDGGKAVKKATRKDNRKAVQKDGWGKYIKESSEWSDN
ncbi:MAG: hypothetical protein K2L12_03985, partial [Clostridia bacterium]|nr:hypothetical protein [Clostridia bacterium]